MTDGSAARSIKQEKIPTKFFAHTSAEYELAMRSTSIFEMNPSSGYRSDFRLAKDRVVSHSCVRRRQQRLCPDLIILLEKISH